MKKNKRIIALLLITVLLMTNIVSADLSSIGENISNIIDNTISIIKLKIDSIESAIAMIKELIPLMLDKFKDVEESVWYERNLALLFGLNIVEGNEQGNFMPAKELTGSEYLKMVVVALDNKNYDAKKGEAWDKPYIDRANTLGLIKKGEIDDFRKPMDRYNMARIIVRACDEEYGDYNKYESYIKDYKLIPDEFKEYVLKAYSKGIINGYTDGTFGGDKTMKRSEATAVIARLIDPSQRVTPKKPTAETKYYDGISFNLIKDTDEKGRMNLEKSPEFIEKVIDNMSFYKENGKYYVKIVYPKMPTGYEPSISITIQRNDNKPVIYFTGGWTLNEAAKIPSSGTVIKELGDGFTPDKIDFAKIYVGILYPNTSGMQTTCNYVITYVPNVKSYIRFVNADTGSGKDAEYDFMKIFKW